MLLSLFFILIFLFSVYIFCRKRADKYDFKHCENSETLKKINRDIKRLNDDENVDELEKLQNKKRLHESLAIKFKKRQKNSMLLFYVVLFIWLAFQLIASLHLIILHEIQDEPKVSLNLAQILCHGC